MIITKEIFDQIVPGEIFRTVTTSIQAIRNPMQEIMTFVCIKGKSGQDWAIYGGFAKATSYDIARYGDLIKDEAHIKSICPCDEEVYNMYKN